MGHMLIFLGQFARIVVEVLELLILVQVVLSWLGIGLPLNRVTGLFYAITEAFYRPVRAILPTRFGGLDFTPLIVLLGLFLIDRWLISAILQSGYRMAR